MALKALLRAIQRCVDSSCTLQLTDENEKLRLELEVAQEIAAQAQRAASARNGALFGFVPAAVSSLLRPFGFVPD